MCTYGFRCNILISYNYQQDRSAEGSFLSVIYLVNVFGVDHHFAILNYTCLVFAMPMNRQVQLP